ncbi:hypothetical protein OF83DRAFT_1067963 [Amylostereum chailletii]|nr:hypothetical protein OF83DRAFT_1067963 [Amylostereum chailletii]
MSTLASSEYDARPVLVYLGLPLDYQPSPAIDPIAFLSQRLHQLPPALLHPFSSIVSPKQRSAIPAIRNRRFKFFCSEPPEFQFSVARREWAFLWEGSQERRGVEEGRAEKVWAESEFMGGGRHHVGKLGALLADYEEERVGERFRAMRNVTAQEAFVPEEDEDSSDESDDGSVVEETLRPEVEQEQFLIRLKEKFVYGLLETDIYDRVDWDDVWDDEERDREERWFEESDDE